MSEPTPASVMFDAFVDQLVKQVSAPLEARIAELETKLESYTGDKFDEAVMEAIGNDPAAVVDAIEDALNDRSDDSLGNKVRRIINSGSFSLDFTP